MLPNGQAEVRGIWTGNVSPGLAAAGAAVSASILPPAAPTTAFFSNRGVLSPAKFFWFGLLVCAAYYFSARIGFALTFKPHPVSVLWLPNSILMAALILTPVRIWWVVLIAILPAHWLVQQQSDVPGSMIVCWYISNCCEAVLGAGAIRYLLPSPVRLDRLRNVGIFYLFGAFLAPFLSSFLDAGFVTLNHWGSGGYWGIWRIRFTSNVLAALTITPFLFTGIPGVPELFRNGFRKKYWEAIALALGLLLTSIAVFNTVSEYDPALLYAPLPFLLWAAVRFGQTGGTAAIAALSFAAIWGAAHGHGPFTEETPEQSALYVQMFLIFVAVPLHLLAALIEERNQVEQTLRERDERVRLAAETANLALWTVDFEGNQAWISEKGRELFQFPANEAFSKEAFLSRVHPEDREEVNDVIEGARSDAKAFEVKCRLLRPNGDVRSLVAHGRYLHNEKGEISELLGVAADVTSQLNADRELRLQREEMIRLNRWVTVGELTASLAHELNQPLSAIVSNASAGMRFIDNGTATSDALREILLDVANDSRRAHDIISNVRNTIKKGVPTRSPVSLNELVRDAVQTLQPDATAYSCEMQTSLANDLPAVEGDPVQISQVLVNLVTNAFEAMSETPVPNRKVEISTEHNGSGTVCVSVRDYGTGLGEAARARLFQQFFTTKPNGLGMGLTIVRSIVEGHGGRITAENVDGTGARFYFTLPFSLEDGK